MHTKECLKYRYVNNPEASNSSALLRDMLVEISISCYSGNNFELSFLPGVKFILNALASSLPPVFYLIIMTLCVMVFFALIGMELFQGVLHGGCYANYTSPTGTCM